MDDLKTLFSSHVDWLTERIRSLAEEHGFTEHPDVAGKPFYAAVGPLNEALFKCFDLHGLEGCSLATCTESDDPVTVFAIEVARRHRKRGVNLAMFMGLLKLYRHSYIHLIERNLIDSDEQEAARAAVARFFDRIEIAQCVNWMVSKEHDDRAREERSNQAISQERNRFQTLFESLSNPVFMLNDSMGIETMNLAAAEFLGIGADPGDLAYALSKTSGVPEGAPASRTSLREVLPWLAEEIDKSYSLTSQQRSVRFDMSADTTAGPTHFNVSISSLANFSDIYTGHTVVLDDISMRVEMERQLSQERNRAAHYLDVVGAIVLALDASCGITLINKAGADVLGYGEFELLGQDWIDFAVPPEDRDELRDYFYHIFSEGVDLDDEHINYVLTKDGRKRLISWKNKLLCNEGGLPIGILCSGTDITEQQAMEDALAEKELWLRNTFLALGEAVLILTPEGEILDANPVAEAMFQMTNMEICAANASDLHVDQAHYEEFDRWCKEAFAKGEPARFEYVRKRKNGVIFPTEHSVSMITGDDGSPLGIVSVTRDISRRKAAELELQQSEEKFRRIFETIEDGYMVSGMDSKIQMVNPATEELLGYTEGELVGQNLGTLYSDDSERTEFVTAIQTKGSVRGFNISAVTKGGATIITEANAHLVLDGKGKPIAIEGTFRDITARIEADKVLREREKQYRAFFENNHAIMLLVDPKTETIEDANPAAGHFYGYDVDTMRGMAMSVISAQTEQEIYREMFQARDEGRVYFIFQHKLETGEVRDVEVYSGPILVQGRQLLYSVIHDVTERIRLEREMTHMATTDALTEINNRHQFFHLAGQELKRAQRYKRPLAVIMLDIDYFKSINDNFGHHTGDVVLKAFATLTRETLRETDILGRLGGEEFAAILPETALEDGSQVAERLREETEKCVVTVKGDDIKFTVSVGVAMVKEGDTEIEDAINRADEALYKAKRTGRNRVVRG